MKLKMLVLLIFISGCSQRFGIKLIDGKNKSKPVVTEPETPTKNPEEETPPVVVVPPTEPPVVTPPEEPPVVVPPPVTPPPVVEPPVTPPPVVEPPVKPPVEPPVPPVTPPVEPPPVVPPKPTPVEHSQEFLIKERSNKVDILFVIDNSASMEFEQKSMAKRMSDFIQSISSLDWQIAVVTTDPNSSSGGDGKLLPFKKDQYILTPSAGSDAQAHLGNTLQRKEVGDSEEQGIRSTYRAIERSATANSSNAAFFRSDAALAVIVISDEDESGNLFRNKPSELVNLVKSKWPQKSFSFHSIITKPGDRACLNGEGYSYGYAYEEMSKLTGHGTTGGSIIGSVCEKDYATQLKGIGQSVEEMVSVWELTCDPTPYQKEIVIEKNQKPYSLKYTLEKNKIVLGEKLSAGAYKVKYKCDP